MTNEAEGLVRKYVDVNKVKFAVDDYQGNASDNLYGIRGFPTSFLIGVDGKILWTGHPASLNVGMLEAELAKAFVVPPLPAKYASINALVKSKQYGKARAAIVKAQEKDSDDALAKALAAIDRTGEDNLARADKAAADEEYATAWDTLAATSREFKGADAGEKAAAKLKAMKADAKVREEVTACRELAAADAIADQPKASQDQLARAYGVYRSVAAKFKDGKLHDRAAAGMDKVKQEVETSSKPK